MRQQILKIEGFNRYSEWAYVFWLDRAADGSFSLEFVQQADDELEWEIEPICGLRTGAEVYSALNRMVETVSSDGCDFDPTKVAAEIAVLDQQLAQQYLLAPEDLSAQEAAARQEEEEEGRRARVAPFLDRIEAYVTEQFSDEKLHYPGAGRVFPSRRSWARKFLYEYAATHGHLPTGQHSIQVPGYSGGSHDFSDLHAHHLHSPRLRVDSTEGER